MDFFAITINLSEHKGREIRPCCILMRSNPIMSKPAPRMGCGFRGGVSEIRLNKCVARSSPREHHATGMMHSDRFKSLIYTKKFHTKWCGTFGGVRGI